MMAQAPWQPTIMLNQPLQPAAAPRALPAFQPAPMFGIPIMPVVWQPVPLAQNIPAAGPQEDSSDDDTPVQDEEPEDLAWQGCAPLQQVIFSERACGDTYAQIRARHPELTSDHKIITCLVRTALGLPWFPGYKGGADPYLCDEDEQKLAMYCEEHSDENRCLRTFEVIDLAYTARQARAIRARELLQSLPNSPDLYLRVSLEAVPPSRSWLNAFAEKYGFSIKRAVEIERDRLRSVHLENLKQFLSWIAPMITGVHPENMFNADETMLSSKKIYKAVTKRRLAVTPQSVPYQHVTAMVTINAVGAQIPPFLILPGLKNLPESLQPFTSRVWFGSSGNGWMTKDLFLCWAINFANWLTCYRATLTREKSQQWSVLFLDGHASRLNPAAMEYLHNHRVHVIIIPSHTSHVLQPFDVGIAGPVKNAFKANLNRFIEESKDNLEVTETDRIRWATIVAMVEALDATTTWWKCRQAFERSGLFPLNPDRLEKSDYVVAGWQAQAPAPMRQYFNLNASILTTRITQMREYLLANGKEATSLEVAPVANYETVFAVIISRNDVGKGKMLTRFHSSI